MAVFGYGRTSTSDQTTENQRLEIEAKGYKLDYWFQETISGKTSTSERPQFQALMGKIRKGETLVVSKLDRIGRDAQDVLATVNRLAKEEINLIVLQLEGMNLTSPAGKLMLTMLSAVAAMERDLLVERTQAGLARAKAEGKVLGRRPKTNDAQQTAIKGAYAAGATVSALARDYDVSRATILSIVQQAA